jgi:hypothetical protein
MPLRHRPGPRRPRPSLFNAALKKLRLDAFSLDPSPHISTPTCVERSALRRTAGYGTCLPSNIVTGRRDMGAVVVMELQPLCRATIHRRAAAKPAASTDAYYHINRASSDSITDDGDAASTVRSRTRSTSNSLRCSTWTTPSPCPALSCRSTTVARYLRPVTSASSSIVISHRPSLSPSSRLLWSFCALRPSDNFLWPSPLMPSARVWQSFQLLTMEVKLVLHLAHNKTDTESRFRAVIDKLLL